MTGQAGYFYAIQLVPDLAPNRVKLGWAIDVTRRLRDHRTAAPTARLVGAWPCPRAREKATIRAIATGRQVGPEVFDVESVDTLIASLDALALDALVANSTWHEPAEQWRGLAGRWHEPAERRPGYALKNLGRVRSSKLLSQERLALAAGVTKQTIHKLETGERLAQASTALRIAKALKVKLQDIAVFPVDDPPAPKLAPVGVA